MEVQRPQGRPALRHNEVNGPATGVIQTPKGPGSWVYYLVHLDLQCKAAGIKRPHANEPRLMGHELGAKNVQLR